MSVTERIVDKLKKFPDVKFEVSRESLCIFPASPSGFEIKILFKGKEHVVAFGRWHGHFETEEEVIEFIGFGLSAYCRLREIRRGDTPCKWVIEQKVDNQWEHCFTSGSTGLRFWVPLKEVIFQNSIIQKKTPLKIDEAG